MAVRHLEIGRAGTDNRRLGLRQSGHGRAEDPQKSERAVIAHHVLHRDPGGQAVDIGLTQRHLIGVGDGEAEHGPCGCDVVERRAEHIGGHPQAVDRAARPLQGVTGEAEQPALTLGLDHLVDREAELVEVVDQAGSFARVGDSCSFQCIEIDHHPSLPAPTPRLGLIPVRTTQ